MLLTAQEDGVPGAQSQVKMPRTCASRGTLSLPFRWKVKLEVMLALRLFGGGGNWPSGPDRRVVQFDDAADWGTGAGGALRFGVEHLQLSAQLGQEL